MAVESVSGCWWNGCPDGHGIPRQRLRQSENVLGLVVADQRCLNHINARLAALVTQRRYEEGLRSPATMARIIRIPDKPVISATT